MVLIVGHDLWKEEGVFPPLRAVCEGVAWRFGTVIGSPRCSTCVQGLLAKELLKQPFGKGTGYVPTDKGRALVGELAGLADELEAEVRAQEERLEASLEAEMAREAFEAEMDASFFGAFDDSEDTFSDI